MTEKELFSAYISALNAHSATQAAALFEDGCTFSDSAMETLGFGPERLIGRDAVFAFFTGLFAKFPALHADMGVQFGSKTYYDVSGGSRNPLRMVGYIDMHGDKIKTMDIWFRDV
jgi:hypothetical protein